MDVSLILKKFGYEGCTASAFKSEEDGGEYSVWKVERDGKAAFVLKKAKGCEYAVYKTFLERLEHGVPKLCGSLTDGEEQYLLMEYVQGRSLVKCERKGLTAVLNELIYIQDMYWEERVLQDRCYSYDESLSDRKRRGEYLPDGDIKNAYNEFLKLYENVPRTLCHDDLLPFNALASDSGAAIIDWEYAGILPYPVPLARLIAHGEADRQALFYMSSEDKEFAMEYYFEKLIKPKGISRMEYYRTAAYFLLYELCEWIAIGEKNNDRGKRYKKYFERARLLIKKAELI